MSSASHLGRLCAAVVVLAWFTLTAALPATALSATAPRAAADPGTDVEAAAVSVELTDIAPAVLRPEEDLVLTATVTNPTGEEISEPEVRVYVQHNTPISRSALDRWFDPELNLGSAVVFSETLDDPLPSGQSIEVTVTVPAESLQLGSTTWGPRGIEVEVRDGADLTRPSAQARNLLVWWPDLDLPATPVSVLVPIVATAVERQAAHDQGTAVSTQAADRLTELVLALEQLEVDLLVDPSVVDASPPPSTPSMVTDTDATDVDADATDTDTDTTDASTADPDDAEVALQLVEALRTASADGARTQVHTLAWADADLAALTHVGEVDRYQEALARSTDVMSSLGLPAGTDLAWPAAGQIDVETVVAVADSGASAIVLNSDDLAPATPLTYTPAGHTAVEAGDERLAALLADERLSSLVIGERLGFTGENLTTPVDALTARQLLLADTAVIARERPSEIRELVIALPRTEEIDGSFAADVLSALEEAPWLEPSSAADVLAAPVTELPREALSTRQVEPGEISSSEVAEADAVLERAEAVASITGNPEQMLGPVRTTLSEIFSAAWRTAPGTRTSIVSTTADAVESWHSLVAALPGSTLNLINNEAHIPVTVTNEMNQDVDVVVELTPRDPRLVAQEAVALEVPAGRSAIVQIPVTAVGSGNVSADVLLRSPEGAEIGTPAQIQVRVRADWETVGTAVLAVVLSLMFVLGLIRTVRRGRRRDTRAQPEPETGGTA